jgi:hypothetical protein
MRGSRIVGLFAILAALAGGVSMDTKDKPLPPQRAVEQVITKKRLKSFEKHYHPKVRTKSKNRNRKKYDYEKAKARRKMQRNSRKINRA